MKKLLLLFCCFFSFLASTFTIKRFYFAYYINVIHIERVADRLLVNAKCGFTLIFANSYLYNFSYIWDGVGDMYEIYLYEYYTCSQIAQAKTKTRDRATTITPNAGRTRRIKRKKHSICCSCISHTHYLTKFQFFSMFFHSV